MFKFNKCACLIGLLLCTQASFVAIASPLKITMANPLQASVANGKPISDEPPPCCIVSADGKLCCGEQCYCHWQTSLQ